MHLHRGPVAAAGDQALELAVAHALVRRANDGEVPGALRVYRPASSVVVLGRRETRAPGFPAVVAAARAAGFEVAIRATGGRAVAYTPAAVVVDHVERGPQSGFGMDERFTRLGLLLRDVLRGLGVDARMGAVPGEYCPGAHSLNARGTAKLVGTAQRVVREAWLFSSLVVVDDAPRVRAVLEDVYRLLDQPFDGASVGSLAAEVPGLDAATVEDALVRGYAAVLDLAEAPLDEATRVLADRLAGQHRVTG